ncbi:histidine phosphatase family protein [Effusibacillus lacus]|uniref:Phosphoglycerate mutase n=1 Tax=Effusibacillus lacus TaxID=1348429 RepID=A0A292YKS8_9BACL|nr:histidine phosphatase family protein [Effusibacillus lacus]TCS70840.1 alpha-ribazole phosphatase/probable phosphoglycerate mutase/uncharacterized phosphatase [Effusibacillus lacus]GAX89363.1 phosphoglycerate mutase [Effusibacillus lacus]
MTRLILIRHGSTDDNLLYRLSGWTDSPLNEAGIRQAECAGDHLRRLADRDWKVAAIYASPLLRAAKTAEIIAERLQMQVNYLDELKEMHFGVFDGLPIMDLYETHKEMVDAALNPGDDEFGWEGGETRPEFFRRIHSAAVTVAERHPEQTVAVVTHAGAIAYFLAGIRGEPLSHWNRYHVANCSLTTVRYRNGEFRLEAHNLTGHVPQEEFDELFQSAKKRLGINPAPLARKEN